MTQVGRNWRDRDGEIGRAAVDAYGEASHVARMHQFAGIDELLFWLALEAIASSAAEGLSKGVTEDDE